MQDRFTGQPTIIQGRRLPAAAAQAALFDDHRRRLAALDRLRAAAAECGLATDPDRDLVLLPEDAVSLLEGAGVPWSTLGAAIRDFRVRLPLLPLETFGFSAAVEDPLAEGSSQLRRIGGGVEAWAFADDAGSVYKFFLPRDDLWIGATFSFHPAEESVLQAEASLGSYRDLLEKLAVISAIGGMPTEAVAVTPEGVVVAKQTLGDRLPERTDTSKLLPPSLIPWPSRFLRIDRDHPRLVFVHGQPWLVADPHDRNIVWDAEGCARIIDLVAAPLPPALLQGFPLLGEWIERARRDPAAPLLAPANDDEL
jgi:hypothetical protein